MQKSPLHRIIDRERQKEGDTVLMFLQTLQEQMGPKLEKCYTLYRAALVRAALGLLKKPEDAEDAVHRVFERMIRNKPRLEEAESLRTRSYLLVAVERAALDILRERSRRDEVPLEETWPGLEAHYSGDNVLADCILKLSVRQRQVILLRYHQGYTQRETANLLEISPSTVQDTEARAKENLRHMLEERGIRL